LENDVVLDGHLEKKFFLTEKIRMKKDKMKKVPVTLNHQNEVNLMRENHQFHLNDLENQCSEWKQ
jgi:hypothetical protein